jgi:Tfp pilus assembly PilM family ATPase
VALALPVRDTFIDHLTIAPNIKDVTQAVFAQMQKKLPFKATPENTIIRYLPSEGRHVVAFALERTRVDRYLALCECAHLHPDTFTVWPTAMASSYAHLWSKKQNDFVMLVDIALNHTNIVVCREATLYYARTIPIGTHDLESGELIELLSAQLDACRKHMVTLYGQHPVQRAIFFAGSVTDHNTIRKIARQARVTAQIGDPFEALTIPADNTNAVRVERCHSSWSVAFGLGLAGRALTGV